MNDPQTAPPSAPEQESGMATGTGADDEPEMTIADKADAPPDPDGDGSLTLDEAKTLLGG